jgi:hypothetical protein
VAASAKPKGAASLKAMLFEDIGDSDDAAGNEPHDDPQGVCVMTAGATVV